MTYDYEAYEKRMAERKEKMLAQPATEYSGGPVYSEDTERYYHDLGTLIDEYWDDSLSPETALIFECTTELAATPDLVEYVDERWGEELEDWDGICKKAEDILRAAEEAIREMAPVVWYPDYKHRLVFDYTGYPNLGDGNVL